jgi:hypothetical protein
MPEAPAPLSAAALRIAGNVGQTALDRIAAGDVGGRAELDQHMAAVRAELAANRLAPSRRGQRATPANRGGRTGHTLGLPARRERLRNGDVRCPDVPFVGDATQAEATVPIRLLLHYACGFVEAAVKDDWWPDESADATDWISLRLAAVCQLILQAEAAAGLHPDLRASA